MSSGTKGFCNKCGINTNHKILHEEKESGDPDDYHYVKYYFMLKCLGCDNVSYREDFHDYEASYPISNNEWETPVDSVCYPPKTISQLRTFLIPDLVRNIFSETCKSIAFGSSTLAGIGLRATIEAVCNQQSIQGRDLSKRINGLVSKGVISKKDALRLHSIRFIGNDAAHDIVSPESRSLEVALSIVEHLLQTLYILDSDSQKILPTIIEEFDEFKVLLSSHLKLLSKGDEYPLRYILGKDVRRVAEQLKEFEDALTNEIKDNRYKHLSLGKVSSFAGSKNVFQHYIVI